MNIAIVAVAYNRIDSLSRLLDSLDKAYFNECEPTLIISVDKSNTSEIEEFADVYEWNHGEKIVDKHEKNLGLRAHMMSLGKWFERFDAIVVLEDDIVVSPNFYTYTCQTVEKYYDCHDIAGISLYGFSVNYQTGLPFEPLKDEHDVYFMNCAMSWGEVWMRDSWRKFYEWYLNHQDFPVLPHLPYSICSWNQKSWLKYHTRYCIEENKYFVHPYVSQVTNYSEAGEHSAGSTIFQVPMQQGCVKTFNLPDFCEDAVMYDGFFENKALYKKLGLTSNDLCLDLQGGNPNQLKKRYWLTTKVANYKTVQTYRLCYRPIELNVMMNVPGQQVFLYDTNSIEKNYVKTKNEDLLFHFHINSMFFFVRRYGFGHLFHDSVRAIKRRILN